MSENEAKVVEQEKTEKELSKTEQFKLHLQKIIYQELGKKVSREVAWSLFKSVIHGTVEHVINIDDKKLSLAGVGKFEVLETKPRGSKAGLDENGNPTGEEAWPCVPRFRFYPSSVIDALCEKTYGLGNHDDLEVKHYGIYRPEDEAPAEKAKPKKEKPAKKENPSADAPAEKSGDPFDSLDDI